MSKDPSPKADQLQAQREARYGHLQAKAEEPKSVRKLIPFAGKKTGGIAPKPAPRKRKTKP